MRLRDRFRNRKNDPSRRLRFAWRRETVANVIELVGLALLVVSAFRLSPTLGIATAGIVCIVVALGLSR